jgi:hypothetical protein
VQIELKKRGVAIREAFNQVHRYSKESFNTDNSLYKYLPIQRLKTAHCLRLATEYAHWPAFCRAYLNRLYIYSLGFLGHEPTRALRQIRYIN